MADKLTLFDIPGQDGKTWSLNPWKSRLLLNYKGLDYQTQWVEYPDIEPTLKPLVEEHDPQTRTWAYTVPVVKFPDGSCVMESKKIAETIESRYPEPSVHIDSPYQAKIEGLVGPLLFTLFGLYVAAVPKNLLNPRSQEYWYKDRPRLVGKPCDQAEKEMGGQPAIDAAKESLQAITALYKENEGVFLEGDKPIYADFQWLGFLVFVKKANPEWSDRVLEATGDKALHEKLIEAAEPWLRRDDH